MSNSEPSFNADDVRRVARALLENSVWHDVQCGRNAHNECMHCDAYVYHDEPDDKIIHDPNCVVLIARDLLT